VNDLRAETSLRIPIRRIPVVLDVLDPLAPQLSLTDFRTLYGKDPDQNRHRILDIEVITSPDDQQPMLVSECARYSRFLRREGQNIYFRVNPDTC
jgi:hypothetical protein